MITDYTSEENLWQCLTLEKVDTIVNKNDKRERFKTKT